jgi:hypothetical protein
MTGFGNRTGNIMSQFRRNLQANKPVTTFRPVVSGTEKISCMLDVFHGQGPIYFINAFAL